MNKTIITALAMSLALGVTAAEARGIGQKLPQFSEVDTDGNGQITEVEMSAIATSRFDAMDANSDGFLDADEMKVRGQMMTDRIPEHMRENDRSERMMERMDHFVENMVERADEDEDGKLSLSEVTSMRRAIPFERVDSNGDGSISEIEWHIAVDHRGGHGRERGPWWGRGRG